MSRSRLMVALVLGLLPGTSVVAQEMNVEVIPLKHRLVQDVLPMIQPMLTPGATATGMGEKLIVKTTPENLDEIKRVLAALDTKIRNLRISVKQDRSGDTSMDGNGLAAELRSGDARVGVADPGGLAGASIGIDGEHGGARYRTFSTQGAEDSQNTHFVRAVEGQPAFIESGSAVPYPYSSSTITPYGATVQEGVDYQNVSSGFYVTPRVQGETVLLEISPQLETFDNTGNGRITSQRATTTVSGRIGEWIPIGGVSETASGNQSALLARTRSTGENRYDAWVKVEIEP